MEEFVGDLGNVVGCINIIRRNPVNTISKVNDFYNSMVTQQEHIYDLKNRNVSIQINSFIYFFLFCF